MELGTMNAAARAREGERPAHPRHRRLRPHRPGDLQHRSRARRREGPQRVDRRRRALQDHRVGHRGARRVRRRHLAQEQLRPHGRIPRVAILAPRRWSAPRKVAGREILLASIFSFLGIALVAPLALIVVIRRFERDLRALEAAASHLEDRGRRRRCPRAAPSTRAIGNLRTSLRDANVALDDLRAQAGLGRLAAPCSRRIISGGSTGASPA